MTPPLHLVDIIRHKRDGRVLSAAEIQHFIASVIDGSATEAQISALLMAIFLQGLNVEELASLTNAMRFSGETFDSAPLASFCVDKHSTGGVGDKTSLLIAPIVAAAGLNLSPPIKVPMISGRSLGHTGGTLDKLETIPGFNTQLSLDDLRRVLESSGACMIGQTARLVPADRILYALRDHTGTIESPNLICASIMSKKLAAGLNGLVLDVKTGSGAFLRNEDDARHLARLMVATGEASGTRTVALLTSMDQPLGRYAGNWLEVQECVEILQNRPHPLSRDLTELSLVLAGWMLRLGNAAPTPEAGRKLAEQALRSGAAYQAWLTMVTAQRGDTSVFSPEKLATHHKPAAITTIHAPQAGYFASLDCTAAGWAVQRLGAGRLYPGEPVSAHAGIEVHAKLRDQLTQGQLLFTLYAESDHLLHEPTELLRNALQISAQKPHLQPLIREILTRQSLAL